MWRKNYVPFFFVGMLVSCESDSRKGRLFSFNTVNDDIRVDLDFSIPFISIPVKQTMETAFGLGIPSVNVNIPGLVLGGAVVLGSTILLPLLIKSFTAHPPYQRYAKILEHTQFGADELVGFASKMINSDDVRGCTLRVACWTGQSRQEDALTLWGRVMSNQLVSTFLNTTAVEEAISSGRQGRDCTFYTPCPLETNHYSDLMKNLAILTKANR